MSNRVRVATLVKRADVRGTPTFVVTPAVKPGNSQLAEEKSSSGRLSTDPATRKSFFAEVFKNGAL